MDKDWDLRLLFFKDGRTEKRPGIILIHCDSGKVEMTHDCEVAPWIALARGEDWVDFNLLFLNGQEINNRIGDFIIDSNKPFYLTIEDKSIGSHLPGSSPLSLRTKNEMMKIKFSGETIILRLRLVQPEILRNGYYL